MKKFIVGAAAILAAMSLPALTATAQNHEVGAGVSVGGTGVLLNGRYGYNINKNFRLEAEAAAGTFILGDVDYFVSAFAVARRPFGENNSAVYARAGAGYMSYTSDFLCGGNFSPCESETRALGQAGVGVEYFFSEKWGVKLDATAVVNPGDLDNGNNDDDFTGYGVFSVVRRF